MIPLPSWARPYLFDRPCPYCNTDKRPEWVCGLGIREIKSIGNTDMQKGNIGLCYEYMCPTCGRYSSIVIDVADPNVSCEDMAHEILRAVKGAGSNVKTKSLPKISPSRISDKEIEDMRRNLEGMSHEDFMRYIGVPQSQIDKYKKIDPPAEEKGSA